MSATVNEAAPQRGFFGHPSGLATLFFTEAWERFSYYGMRVLLVLFLSSAVVEGGLGLDKGLSSSIVSVYGSLIYMSGLVGGWVADRLFGAQRSVLYGAAIIMLGHIAMAIPLGGGPVFVGMFLVIAGTSLLKPNISTAVGGLYEKGDTRRDAGFSIFYMGINLGSFAGITIAGWLGQKINWHLGFGAAAVGMAIGLVVYIAFRKNLGAQTAVAPNPLSDDEKAKVYTRIGLGVAALVVVLAVLYATDLLSANLLINSVTILSIALPVWYFTLMLRSPLTDADEKSRVRAYIPLFIAATLFWMIFEQAANVLALYAEERTRNTVFGWEFPSSWFQSVNPVFVLLFAPIVATVWVKLGRRQPSTARKFAVAMVLIGVSFLLLVLAANAGDELGKVSPLWLLAVYGVQTIGELLLSPVGLSATSKVAPKAFTSQMMALWFLSSAAGLGIAAQLVPLYGVWSDEAYFGMFGGAAVLFAVLLWVGSNKIRTAMRGVE
ncbi:POT family proton-dependent oligopeptide transporter [Crossiella equi]|uniref:POT family proton-dependent oligopeptide transporter n=1 Tax=Crossiella equi TaxID=130796 RepID=A0ABS5A9I9_9PSEU|nr:peptide MFS transporter [Crossiella equi]MBP2472971.1 POT family proton-dependent oligopeptide transporter [Crossiella equi]